LKIFTLALYCTLVAFGNRKKFKKMEKKHTEDEELSENLENAEQKLIPEEDPDTMIHELTDQIQLLQDKLLRSMAETENVRTRLNKNVEEAREYSIISFAKDLVPVVDNLSRALAHVPANLDDVTSSLIQGVQMTQKELENVFRKHGLEAIEPQEGEKFDYNAHHAITQVVTDKHKAGTIVNTMQVGYKIKDRLIRPASVAVAKN
jgi:molecular chaperone GrpE